MRHLILILALVSIQGHADEGSARMHDEVMGPASEYQARELAPILETPAYQPATYSTQPYQSDSEWSRSVQQLDTETRPRY